MLFFWESDPLVDIKATRNIRMVRFAAALELFEETSVAFVMGKVAHFGDIVKMDGERWMGV